MDMRALIETIFGTYTPITSDVVNDAGEVVGSTVVSGMAGVDWTYILGVLLFALVLYCFFRLLGVVLRHG